VWRPSGPAAFASFRLEKGKIVKAERMPLQAGDPEQLEIALRDDGTATLEAGENPVFIWVE
jgi:hypothetical protein